MLSSDPQREPVRVIQPPPREGRRPSVHCKECGAATKDGKPYCSRHVLLNPYVKAILTDYRERA